jgi:hypothetical protein
MGKCPKGPYHFQDSEVFPPAAALPAWAHISTSAHYPRTAAWQKLSRIRTAPSASMPKTKKFFDSGMTAAKVGPGTYNPKVPEVGIRRRRAK